MEGHALTIEMLRNAHDKLANRGYIQPHILLSQVQIDGFIALQKYQTWYNGLSKIGQFKEDLKNRRGKYKKKLPLPE